MSNLRQAAQQALEFLSHDMVAEDWSHQKRKDAVCDALRAALAEPEQEPVAWMFQHEETGRTMCVDTQQVEWGFEKGNPRLKKIAPLYTASTPQSKPQTTHWEGCEAVHPECKTEHGVKDLSNYEFKTYKIGGFQLEAGFYSADELRDLIKAFDKMNAVAERSMRRKK